MLASDLRAKLIAATLTRKQFLQLRNTVWVLRGSGVQLDHEQERKCREFQAVVKAYEEKHHEK